MTNSSNELRYNEGSWLAHVGNRFELSGEKDFLIPRTPSLRRASSSGHSATNADSWGVNCHLAAVYNELREPLQIRRVTTPWLKVLYVLKAHQSSKSFQKNDTPFAWFNSFGGGSQWMLTCFLPLDRLATTPVTTSRPKDTSDYPGHPWDWPSQCS